LLSGDCYVYVDADPAGLYPIARALRSWTEAIADGSVRVYGAPDLVRALPTWFMATEPAIPNAKLAAPAVSVVA
jgi:hypothetical protein